MKTLLDTQSVLLLICDISGYTRFMIANREAERHGYVIIAELMQAVLQQVRSPLQVAKLEGDAVFLYVILPKLAQDQQALGPELRSGINKLFWVFDEKLTELVQSNICSCGGCVNAGHLRLKMVVHVGQAVLHQIGRFSELSGVDVILVHRLLKNSLHRDQYILLTEAAYKMLWPEPETPGEMGEEYYEDLGRVGTVVVSPAPRTEQDGDASRRPDYTSLLYKTKNILRRIFAARLLGLRRKPLSFTHFPLPGE